MGEAINQLFQRILEILTPIIIPDWGALIGLMPILLLIGVVGPLFSLILLLWFIYVVRKPRARIPYVEPQPVPAPIEDGQPVYPAGEPYCAFHRLIYPPGSTTCTIDGRDLAVRCPKCHTGRVAYIDTCSNCGLVLKIEPRIRALQSTGPPPGGAAAA
ncbi:MAG TPA: hypothetical protein VEX41_03180 [Candidatus Eisenbacteria bacterium]|nr:hypothetical protein [Candidatus Eisenbacteria bacterium]